jgi:hypothetical protein
MSGRFVEVWELMVDGVFVLIIVILIGWCGLARSVFSVQRSVRVRESGRETGLVDFFAGSSGMRGSGDLRGSRVVAGAGAGIQGAQAERLD